MARQDSRQLSQASDSADSLTVLLSSRREHDLRQASVSNSHDSIKPRQVHRLQRVVLDEGEFLVDLIFETCANRLIRRGVLTDEETFRRT